MKIVLDIDKLLEDAQITREEYDRLKGFAARDTGSLAFNILIGFGTVATAAGALALFQSAGASVLLGFVMSGAGIALRTKYLRQWGVLGFILLLVGSMLSAGGIIFWTNGGVTGFMAVTILCIAGGILARSGLLIAMSALALSATIGAATAYDHAMYTLIIRQPTLTVVIFSALGWAAYVLSLRLPADFQRLSLVFARTSVLLVNFGFWVGSLWGDDLMRQGDAAGSGSVNAIPDTAFVIAWAVALIATGVWSVRSNRRWVTNTVAVFGSIHFYTQYFELLGPSPVSMLIGGVLALGIALAIGQYNKGFKKRGPAPEPELPVP